MPSTNYIPASVAIGQAFKGWRDQKRLSLRDVEEASRSHPESVSFEYVSRLERGLVMPSVPKLTTLAAIYGRPVYELLDLYETVRMRALAPARRSYETFRRLAREHLDKGELHVAIGCFLAALEVAEAGAKPNPERLAAANADVGHTLVEAGRHITARNYFEEALRRTASSSLRSSLLGDLAIAHQQVGNAFLAEILAKQGLALAVKEDVIKAKAHAALARILFNQGRFKEAESPLRLAVVGWHVSGEVAGAIEEVANLGMCLVKLGKTTEGLEFLAEAANRAGKQKRPQLRAATLLMQGKGLYIARRTPQALGPLLGALRIARDHDLREEAFRSAYYLWRIAEERAAQSEIEEYVEIARVLRPRIMGSTEEVAYFDQNVPHVRRRRRLRERRRRR